jgi:transposase
MPAEPHCAYLFANRRAKRMKVLVHDGVGIWLAARRLNQGKFHWPGIRDGSEVELDNDQLQALVLGLPWQPAAHLYPPLQRLYGL